MDLASRLPLNNDSFGSTEDRLKLFGRATIWLEYLSPDGVDETDILCGDEERET